MTKENTMKTMTAALLTIGLLSTAAHAHGTVAAAYGGQVVMAGDLHVEVALRDGGVRAWVRDHGDAPVAATGKATLLVAGKKLEVPLTAKGDGLAGEAPVKSGDKVAAVLSLTVDGKPVSVRFAQDEVVRPALPPQAQAGGSVFAQICAACHGTSLRGTDAGPPLLHPYYAAGSGHGDEVILSAVTSGAKSHHWKFGDMPKPDGVKPGQEKDVLSFIRAMQAANGIGGAAAPMPADMHAGHH